MRLVNRWLKITILGIVLFFTSCNQSEIYHSYQELEDASWSKFDTLYFDIDSSNIDFNSEYNIDIELVNNTEYPYQNLWLYIEDDIQSDKFHKVEKQYELADARGKWNGSGFGSLFQLTLRYKHNIRFEHKKSYRVKIVQGMVDEPLKGIEKIGLIVIPSDDKQL